MRIFCLFTVLLAGSSALLGAEWRLEFSTQLPSRRPAVTHQLKHVRDDRPLDLHLVKFDRARCTLRVIDLAADSSVAEAVQASGGLAGVNGGYFKPDHSPLGLVISGGVKLHPQEQAKILSGVLLVTNRGASLLRTAELRASARLQSAREAIQAGPFLVDHGKPVSGLNATRAAERTVLLADKEGVMALLTIGPVTLAELAKLLATPGVFSELHLDRALNLDGGSSTALWVDAEPAPFSRPEWKRVRNAVAIVPRR